MQLQTIKFTADEQSLQRTSGGSLFASSTVSYIRALFDLGDNWGSWGAVRAVWKARGQQIATVLADGACMVPAEVLAQPGRVQVNLVASEISGNTVTDRLTTYPIVALVVDALALVDGTETAEITPSQFEQFVNAVEDYSEQAISARDRAETAADNAERDAGIASGAKTDAETAQRKAEGAQRFAEEASTAAGLSASDADRSEGEAAAWATGSYSGDGGLPVPPSAPQHNNNAKYYSEQAESALAELESASATASTLPAGSSATASYSDGVFSFGIPRGDKGDTGNTGATGPAAGFGEVSATVDSSVGTPSVEVSASGPDTAKQFAFAFHNLKGDKGDTGEVSEAELAAYVDKVAIKDTASGPIASFPDGADGMPLKSLVVNIEPVQAGSGDPSPDNVRPISGWTGAKVYDDPKYGGEIDDNQMIVNGDFSDGTTGWTSSQSFAVSNGVATFKTSARYGSVRQADDKSFVNGHKYLFLMDIKGDSNSAANRFNLYMSSSVYFTDPLITTSWARYASMITYNKPSGTAKVIFQDNKASDWDNVYIKNVCMFDLTQMFGAGNEPATVEAFTALFYKDYYAYNTGEKTCVSAINGDPYWKVPITWQDSAGTVYGGTVDVVSGELKARPYYASYAGEALVGPWVSSMDAYTPGGTPTTGAQVVDLGGTVTEYTLAPEQIVTLLGQNNIWASTGNTEVKYVADPAKYIDKKLAALA